jgi:hypothetical protein
MVGGRDKPHALVHREPLALIAGRLGRTITSVRSRLRDLGYAAKIRERIKVKEVAEMFWVPPARVQYWVAEKLLLTKGERITESSLSKGDEADPWGIRLGRAACSHPKFKSGDPFPRERARPGLGSWRGVCEVWKQQEGRGPERRPAYLARP